MSGNYVSVNLCIGCKQNWIDNITDFDETRNLSLIKSSLQQKVNLNKNNV